jgi:hypothetical protein
LLRQTLLAIVGELYARCRESTMKRIVALAALALFLAACGQTTHPSTWPVSVSSADFTKSGYPGDTGKSGAGGHGPRGH